MRKSLETTGRNGMGTGGARGTWRRASMLAASLIGAPECGRSVCDMDARLSCDWLASRSTLEAPSETKSSSSGGWYPSRRNAGRSL